MQEPRLKRAERNVVSMRDWQKITRQRPKPPKPDGLPLWLVWLMLATIAAILAWWHG